MKEQALLRTLATWPSLIVAYSGGVDSAYLAWAAHARLGRRALCITADSPSYPERHRALALPDCRRLRLRARDHPHRRDGAARVPRQSREPLLLLQAGALHASPAIARARGIPAIADGSNADDRGDYRPGRQAASEHGVISPLDEVGLTKDEIRELSRRAGLPTWDEPASACLSSRIPYFSEVTDAKLRMIEQAEAVLRDLGFRVCRVRHHGDERPMARVEIGRDEMARARAPEMTDAIDRGAARARLRAGHAGSARLSPRQPQRRASTPPGLIIRRAAQARRRAAVVSLRGASGLTPPTLEDLDSVNFALGVRHFDVAQHQPHPPGYPLFIALGKVGTSCRALGRGHARRARPGSVERAGRRPAAGAVLFVFFRT